jgi:hypothetical protein
MSQSLSWYDPQQLYTINVILSKQTEDGLKALQYPNIIGEALKIFRNQVWNQGLSYKRTDGSIELIQPSWIETVLILPQKNGKI